MRNPRASVAEKLDAFRIQLHTVCMPHVGTGPAQLLGVSRRCQPKVLQAVAHVFLVLGQMSVQRNSILPRQDCGLPH